MRKSFLALIFASVIAPEVMADGVYSVPFIDDFDANTKREEFTIIDANHDGVTLKRHYRVSIFPGFYPDTDFKEMEYDSEAATQKADDWFITPKIHLEAGKVYSFAYNAYVGYDSYQQLMEVKIGKGVTVADMKDEVMRVTTISSSGPRTFENEFTVEEDGDYNIGMHILSEPQRSSLYFTHIVVKQSSSDNVPAKISDLIVNADPKGKLLSTITFTAPSKTISGNDLQSLTKVELSRNGELFKTVTDVQPGQHVSCTDNSPRLGYNNYTVIAYNAEGKGIRASVDSVYVGVDCPLPPTGFTLTDGGDEIIISWNKVDTVGCNGYVVNPDEVTYNIEALNSSYSPVEELTRTADLTFHYKFNTLKGEQDLKRFGIRSMNAAGWSDFAYARMIIGNPYALPYRESFATGSNHKLTWQEGSGTFYVTTEESVDGDAGCVKYVPAYNGEEVSFNLGKMNLRQALHPVMRFSYKGLTKNDSIVVRGVRQDGTSVVLGTLNGVQDDWTTITLDMQQLAGETCVIPKLLTKGTKGKTICLDDFEIVDLYDCDLSITLEADVQEDNHTSVQMTVTNEGMTEVSDYDLVLTLAGEVVQRINVTDALPSGQKQVTKTDIVLDYRGDESLELKAQVVCLYDLNPDNDVYSVQVVPNKNALAVSDETALQSLLENIGPQGIDIYALDGRLVRHAAYNTMGLPKGIYVLNGKKICIK